MMARYIDANTVQLKIIKVMREPDYQHENEDWRTGLCIADDIINEQPTADVVEVKRGKWELYGDDDSMDMIYWCSCCRFHLSEDLFYKGYENGNWIENNVFKFCPNCGADMRGGAE
jgi:hypothetical protein